MKSTIDLYQFRRAFEDIRPENFSYDGQAALFEWIECLDDDCGTETELDVIALCCDFSEYASLREAAKECGFDYDGAAAYGFGEGDDLEDCFRDWLQFRTTIIEFDGGVIVQAF